MNDDERFWSKVDRSGGPDACWPWTAAVNVETGYGVFHPSRRHPTHPRTVTAHRYSAFLARKIEMGDSRHVDHACHNDAGCPPGRCSHRICCNPRHLDPTTNRENLNRSHNSNVRKTHCPRGHEYTEANTRLQVKKTTTSRTCRTCQRERDRSRTGQ